jgi:ParB/RepB/Spo0J family partition protein
MKAPSFENIADDLFTQEEPWSDSLYKPKKVKDIARRLTFVLFDEIVEDSTAQSRREVFDPAKNKEDQELLSSIKANGIITPLIVRQIEDGKNRQGKRNFALVAGHRRLAAGKLAGINGTEGVVCLPDEDHQVITVAENLGRRELSTFEKGLSLQSLKEQRKFSIRKVAEATGLSKSYVNELILALQSPTVLKHIWEDGELSPKAVVLLKDHWTLFEQEEAAPLHKQMRGLSQQQASDLSDLLNAGAPLKKALAVIISTGQSNKPVSGKSTARTSSTDHGVAGVSKDELLAAITEVFPKVNEKKAQVLYDFAVVNGIQDPEILWAAALYVDRGGNINQAVELTSTVMEKRSRKSILSHEVRLMKKVACAINTMTKEDKIIIDYLQVVFISN